MPRRPRLMYLATTSGTGGAERQVHDLAVRMHERGWAVTAVSMLPLEPTFADLPAAGVAIASLGMTRARPHPAAFVRFLAMLRDVRPDVLHAHMVHANLLARLSRLARPSTPVVISTMHNQYQGARWRMLAYRLTDRLGDATTAVSDAARDEAIRAQAVAANRIETLPNGIDTSRFAPDDATRARLRRELGVDDRFVWLAAGRLTAAKDYPNLLRALVRLQVMGFRPQVLVAGGGPDEQAIRDQVAADGLSTTVRLLGVRSDIPDVMRAADGFVMSSAWEGLPLVLLEAAASSLPIVATDVGGNRDAVVEGSSGFIVPAADDATLAERMAQVMRLDEVERGSMGSAGRSLALSRYDIDAVLDRWDAMYRGLLSR